MTLRGLVIAGVAAVLVGGAPNALAENGNRYDTYTVEQSRIDSRVVLGGTVVPERHVTIAAQMPGRVEFIAGSEGDAFDDGEVLVALNDDELLARRRAALAQMGNADAALRNAGVQYTRELVNPNSQQIMPGMMMPWMFDSMFSRNFGNMMGMNSPGMDRTAELMSRSTHIEQARSSFLQAQSQLEEVDAKLSDTKGYAPFNGVITQKHVEVGDTVQPGQPLVSYADTRSLQVQVEVPARLMPGIRVGDRIPTRLDVRDAITYSEVAQIFPMADAHRHTVTIKLNLPDSAPAAPGMYTEVMITDHNANASSLPVVPAGALVRRGSLPALFVVNEKGETELRLVRLGDRINDQFVTVLSGVRSGERVVRNPTPGMTSTAGKR